MKTARRRRTAILLCFVLSAGVSACGGGKDARPLSDVASLGWMVGSWEERSDDGSVLEKWSAAADGGFVGTGTTIIADSVTFTESLRISVVGDTVRYIATLEGSEPVTFTATSLTDDEVVFENPVHDYPQRIVYSKPAPDSLIARIEGTADGEVQMDEFNYSRAGRR